MLLDPAKDRKFNGTLDVSPGFAAAINLRFHGERAIERYLNRTPVDRVAIVEDGPRLRVGGFVRVDVVRPTAHDVIANCARFPLLPDRRKYSWNAVRSVDAVLNHKL